MECFLCKLSGGKCLFGIHLDNISKPCLLIFVLILGELAAENGLDLLLGEKKKTSEPRT